MRKALSLGIAVAVVLVAPAVVPETAAQDPTPDFYGTTDTNYHYISAEEFQSQFDKNCYYSGDGFWSSASGAPGCVAMASLRLPSGALVDGYTVVYDDSDAVFALALGLGRYWVSSVLGTAGTAFIGPSFTSTGAPGITSTWVDLVPDLTISYFNVGVLTTQSYAFVVALPNTEDVRFRGVIVKWKRQISPAPVDPTFPDVAPGFWAFQYIEALAASEITTGFPDGTFRPLEPVTRAQMATFLARALGLHWAP